MLRPSVLIVFGTRPEAIKLAPLILKLQEHQSPIHPIICHTGQHSEMVAQVLDWFGIRPDLALEVMQPGQDLAVLTARVLLQLAPILSSRPRPSAVVIQGDTTTAMAASLAAFYAGIPVAHVEAGLRTGDLQRPFPEELNRRIATLTSRLHFAPTTAAAATLVHEGIPAGQIFTVGNTVIDALRLTRERLGSPSACPSNNGRRILVTAHRRESFGHPFEEICRAIHSVADRNPSYKIIFPVHLNPNVRDPVARWLSGHPQIELLEPLQYERFVELMLACDLILTDSGGIQEEAAALGKPALVLRETTERPEVLAAGTAQLVGSQHDAIVEAVENVLQNPGIYALMSRPSTIFGDGHAAKRIVQILADHLVYGQLSPTSSF